MRARLLLTLPPLTFAAASLFACGVESPAASSESQPAVQAAPERAEPAAPEVAEPATPAETAEPAAPPPALDPELDPVMAERKQALANVGRSAFDALKSGEFDALLALTPSVDPYLVEVCAQLPMADAKELAARFRHCHKAIAWDAVTEAEAFAAKPTGQPAGGCDDGIEDYGRLQLFVHMQDKSIWRVEFFGAVGEDGKAIGLNGEVRCSPSDDAPELR